jgi:hypothetical protein
MKSEFLFWFLISVWLIIPPAAKAQPTGKVFRIGYLDPSTSSSSADLVDAFRQELSKLGWIEGKNIVIEYRLQQERMTGFQNWPPIWFNSNPMSSRCVLGLAF